MSQCYHSIMSQVHEMTTSSWGHSVVTGICSHCEVIMMSLWYPNYDITCVSCVWGHSDTSWIHHREATVLSQYDFKDTRVDHITMRSQRCHSMMSQVHEMTTSSWGHCAVTRRCPPWEVIMMSSWYQNYDITCVWCLLGHSDKSLPHHCEGTVLS